VVNAYLIAFGGLPLLAGRLGDLISRRGVFLAGLAVFTAASAVCGAAQSPAMLVAARFVQGIGGALTSAVILAVVRVHGRVRATVPFAWLIRVWARGLAVVGGRFCLDAETDDGRTFTLTVVALDLGPPETLTLTMPG
jgi:MFS family permease